MNIKNLLKLADGLEGIPQEFFDIGNYRKKELNSVNDVPFKSKSHCGAIGCAMGWGPFIQGLKPPEHCFNNFKPEFKPALKELSFTEYSFQVFEVDVMTSSWDWCFSNAWQDVDNTAIGASLRIRELALNGLPYDSNGQMYGRVPYMFAEEIK